MQPVQNKMSYLMPLCLWTRDSVSEAVAKARLEPQASRINPVYEGRGGVGGAGDIPPFVRSPICQEFINEWKFHLSFMAG